MIHRNVCTHSGLFVFRRESACVRESDAQDIQIKLILRGSTTQGPTCHVCVCVCVPAHGPRYVPRIAKPCPDLQVPTGWSHDLLNLEIALAKIFAIVCVCVCVWLCGVWCVVCACMCVCVCDGSPLGGCARRLV